MDRAGIMKSIKIQMILATITAILTGLLMLEISHHIIIHNANYGKIPIPEPSITHQIFTAFLWIGLAILIALFITVLVIATNQIKKRQHFNHMEKYNFQQSETNIPPNPINTHHR